MKFATTLISILLTLFFLTSCSSEQLRRTTYETIKAADRQRCLDEAFSDCPRQPEYDDFQQKREDVLNQTGAQ
ncbi:MAG: hypothetical protein HKM94_06080 [Halobacteria archaeon]|nr:hypothetical protein [Halobacteria archaeon]